MTNTNIPPFINAGEEILKQEAGRRIARPHYS